MLAGFAGRDPDGDHFEVQWHHAWNRVTPRSRGVTGWATVIKTQNFATARLVDVIRIHKCANNPCDALWTSYGNFAPPMHLQQVSEYPDAKPSAVAEAKPSAVADPNPVAVARPDDNASDDGEQASQDPEDDDLDAQASLKAAVAASDSVPLPLPLLPDEPRGAGLRMLGAAPVALAAQAPCVDWASDSARVPIDIMGKVLKLARDIREPNSWVGYSFFILFGLCKKCLPMAWEGTNRLSIIETFAPWALESCTTQCAVDCVCCALQVHDGGQAMMLPVSEDCPLHTCKHFLAAVPTGAGFSESAAVAASTIENFYLAYGMTLVGTVSDGDCGVDVACMMLGLPQGKEVRNTLRKERPP